MMKRPKPVAIVYLRVAYLNQHKGCIVHSQEGERLGIPEALDDKWSLQQDMK